MGFCCSRFSNHTISSISHQNHNLHINMNITLIQLCREERLKEAVHILLTTNTLNSLHSSTCLQLLQTCIAKKALSEGKLLHSFIDRIGLKFSPSVHKFLQNKLIHMYVNCGSLTDARKVFDCMTKRNVFSWNMIISAYQIHGFPRHALKLYHQMRQTGGAVQPDQFTFPSILKACTKLGDSQQGLTIHQTVLKTGFFSDVAVATALIDMYAKWGGIEKARKLFHKMTHRNAFSWNAMIAGYAQNGFSEKALETFKQMKLSGVKLDSVTFASILPACANMGALEEGMDIHQKVLENIFSADVVVVNALIDMYAKCGRIHKARELFDKMHNANTVSWTAMIAGYAQNGQVENARELFDKMPNQNAVSWTAMIAGYAQNGFSEKALETFKQMQLSGVKPDSVTFASILPACAKTGALEDGMDIHQRIVENGFSSDVVVVSALIDMYAKCGRIDKARELFDKMHDGNTFSWTAMIAGYAQNGHVEKARELFDKMPHRGTVSWNAMIAGYTQNGFFEKALETFKLMQFSAVKPDSVTFASILPACANIGALQEGVNIHQKVIENRLSADVVAVNALIDMYAKCGRIDKARELFDKMHDADTVLWNAMIAGYAIHGYSEDALKLFDLMKHLGTNPDNVTFACVLFACSHAGLVDESCTYFNSMNNHCIIPGMDHYVCIVDLLGRAGYLEEALNFIAKMPIEPELVLWMCLLGACRSHKNLGIGEFVATILFVLEPKHAASYVLLSNIYAEVGSWDDVQRVRTLMKDRGIKKTPGCSWIEVHKRIHVF